MLWDVAERRRLTDGHLTMAENRVERTASGPEGGGGVVPWDMNLESWKRKAGRIANRNFTRKEWQEYLPDQPYRKTFDWLPDAPVTELTSRVGTSPTSVPPRTRKD